MKRARCFQFVLVSSVACSHDASSLTPSIEDVHGWTKEFGEYCGDCLASECEAESSECIADRECHEALSACTEQNPACAQGPILHWRMASCLVQSCREQCAPRENRLNCRGHYDFSKPDRWMEVNVIVEGSTFQNFPYDGEVAYAICYGSPLSCEDEVPSSLGKQVMLSYKWGSTPWRPYVRITGEGLQTLYLSDDMYILEGHYFTQTAVPKPVYQGMLFKLNATYDPGLGTLNAITFDCQGGYLDGVTYELVDNTESVSSPIAYYFRDTEILPASQLSHTTETGMGGFAQLKPANYGLIARKDGQIVARADAVAVEADAITQMNLMPLTAQEASLE